LSLPGRAIADPEIISANSFSFGSIEAGAATAGAVGHARGAHSTGLPCRRAAPFVAFEGADQLDGLGDEGHRLDGKTLLSFHTDLPWIDSGSPRSHGGRHRPYAPQVAAGRERRRWWASGEQRALLRLPLRAARVTVACQKQGDATKPRQFT
jgi:hypothetical protein